MDNHTHFIVRRMRRFLKLPLNFKMLHKYVFKQTEDVASGIEGNDDGWEG